MNTYDPAHGIRYVHLAIEPNAPATGRTASSHSCTSLPAGYANASPHTCLRTPESERVGRPAR